MKNFFYAVVIEIGKDDPLGRKEGRRRAEVWRMSENQNLAILAKRGATVIQPVGTRKQAADIVFNWNCGFAGDGTLLWDSFLDDEEIRRLKAYC